MITGEITVSTCYGDATIPVEILDTGPRPGLVKVRALNHLTPFIKMSHGGPCQDDTALWDAGSVRNVRIVVESAPPSFLERSNTASPRPAAQECVEWAGLAGAALAGRSER